MHLEVRGGLDRGWG